MLAGAFGAEGQVTRAWIPGLSHFLGCVTLGKPTFLSSNFLISSCLQNIPNNTMYLSRVLEKSQWGNVGKAQYQGPDLQTQKPMFWWWRFYTSECWSIKPDLERCFTYPKALRNNLPKQTQFLFWKRNFILFTYLGFAGLHRCGGFSLTEAGRGYSLQCMGFSLQRLLPWQSTGYGAKGFSSCGTRG